MEFDRILMNRRASLLNALSLQKKGVPRPRPTPWMPSPRLHAVQWGCLSCSVLLGSLGAGPAGPSCAARPPGDGALVASPPASSRTPLGPSSCPYKGPAILFEFDGS